MKKLLLILLCLPFIGFGQSQEISWEEDLFSAFNLASLSNKIIMIEFMAEWCPPCKRMEKETFSNDRVINKSNEFIFVKVDVDKHQDIAKEYKRNAKKYGGIGIPNILFIDKDKNIVYQTVGFLNANQLITVMDSVLKK
ncbi:thioredoxin domain-containing protein [Flavobacteriales bacterium]|nr:thioredoxin domain-containing protein [Flavobacteriales bacterium]